jgi:hypothetical protein
MAIAIKTQGTFYRTYRALNAAFGNDTLKCAEATVSDILNKKTSSDHPLVAHP